MATKYGTEQDETITGTSAADTIFARGGNDVLKGLAGRDRLYGQEGDDLLFGGRDDDVVNGGAGIDRASWYNDGGDAGVSVYLDSGSAMRESESDRLVAIENATGTIYDDYLRGDAGANDLRGAGGSDVLDGLAGNDRLYGESGRDTLYGGAGDDWLDGGAGTDFFRAEAGNDTIILGDDADDEVFFLYYGLDPSYETIGADTVKGFSSGLHDLDIDLLGALPEGREVVIEARDFLDSNDDGAISDGDLEVAQVGDDLVLDLDALMVRALGGGSYGKQEIRIEGAGQGFGAGQVESVLEPGVTWNIPVMTEAGIIEPPVTSDAIL